MIFLINKQKKKLDFCFQFLANYTKKTKKNYRAENHRYKDLNLQISSHGDA